MKTKNSIGLWPGSNEQLRKLPLASIMTIALFASSCKSTEIPVRVRETQSDTLQERRSAQVTLMPVPLSRTTLALPLPQLRNLPQGASYSNHQGQARLSVTRLQSDTLLLTATCDSLARQVILLTEELTRARSKTERQEEISPTGRSPTGWQWFWIRLGQLSAVLLTATVIGAGIRKR